MSIEVSVIIPVFNMVRDGLLNRCIDSLINQTYPKEKFEIIAVDDCSTDDSYILLENKKKEFSKYNIRILKTPRNLKQGGARNLGINASLGKYITFVDADDYVSEDYISLLVESIIMNKSDMSAGCYQFVFENNKVMNTLFVKVVVTKPDFFVEA